MSLIRAKVLLEDIEDMDQSLVDPFYPADAKVVSVEKYPGDPEMLLVCIESAESEPSDSESILERDGIPNRLVKATHDIWKNRT